VPDRHQRQAERRLRDREGRRDLRDKGDADAAVRIALDVEQLVHEANTLLNAASLMNRLANEPPDPPGEET
jgi:hypothetical protein